jgi:hypothetical protein
MVQRKRRVRVAQVEKGVAPYLEYLNPSFLSRLTAAGGECLLETVNCKLQFAQLRRHGTACIKRRNVALALWPLQVLAEKLGRQRRVAAPRCGEGPLTQTSRFVFS